MFARYEELEKKNTSVGTITSDERDELDALLFRLVGHEPKKLS